jgi:hypothetical protein
MQHQPQNTLVTLKEMQCKIGKENLIYNINQNQSLQ